MSDSEQNNKINDFAGITNVDQERAKFYLESAAWNLDVMIEKKKPISDFMRHLLIQ